MSGRKIDQDQWLEEASTALAEAERLTGLLASTQPQGESNLAAVKAEIMSLREDVERIRRDRRSERRRDFDPKWLEYSAWTAAG